MEPDKLSNSISSEFATAWAQPVPVLVLLIIVGGLIWAALQWRYGAIVERLKDENEHLKKETPSPARLATNFTVKAKSSLATEPRAAPRMTADGRVWLGEDITPAFLTAQCKGQTSLQAATAFAGYIGKWMKVSGTVIDVNRGDGIINVVVKPTGTRPLDILSSMAKFEFPHDWPAAGALHKNAKITLTGQLCIVTTIGIVLSNGELVS